MEEIPSSQTLSGESPPQKVPSLKPDLSTLPTVLVIDSHLKGDELRQAEDTLRHHGAPLTSDVSQAKLFIGKVGTKARALFELRKRKFKTEEIVETKRPASPVKNQELAEKKRRIEGTLTRPIEIDEDSSTDSETDDETVIDSETEDTADNPTLQAEDTPFTSPSKSEKHVELPKPVFENYTRDDVIWLVKLDWLNDCIAAQRIVPITDYLVFKGKVIERPPKPEAKVEATQGFAPPHPKKNLSSQMITPERPGRSILERAKADIAGAPSKSTYHPHKLGGHGSRHFEGRLFASSSQTAGQSSSKLPHLLQQSTSDYEGEDTEIPPPPDWVKKRIKYACQRLSPVDPPNKDFIEELKKIRRARILTGDEIGVRAYSTSIAAIVSYPYKFIHPKEIIRLPGCENKIATLWVEYKNTGKIQAVEEFENDEAMKVLRLFYEIWGVGAHTARKFYHNNHWQDLDDIVEFGWSTLTRVEQIGVKYYDEFQESIPRVECEQIASVVREHAVRVRDDRISVTIVGGYRRGKESSGDVDIIVSHPELNATAGLVPDIVASLEEEWITHTLIMSLFNTERGQSTLQFRTTKASGAGFDTLDKALVVWQDPNWPTKEADLAADERAKNPNIHRRVDIIVSPWRTVGCAVMGWSGGMTFQRDLRRYAKNVKGWKFDSSGIRSRGNGEIIDIEGPNGIDGTPEDAERRVFEGLRLEYIPPDQRCTN